MVRFDCRGLPTEALAASQTIRQACECFSRDGYVVLDHVIDEARVRSLRSEFDRICLAAGARALGGEVLEVSDRRFMIGVHLSGGFADRLVFANPFVMALVHQVLGQGAILEAFGAIVSEAGAAAQVMHRDAPALFSPEISAVLPAYALTVALPLVEMNEVHGTTAVLPGSHRRKQDGAHGAALSPTVPVGSCLIWDFRLEHSGTANRSDQSRPMLYGTYARRWYRDPVNFTKGLKRRLSVDPAFMNSADEEIRALLSRAM